MVGEHQVLVAAAGADGEASCVVCVERSDGFYPKVKLFDGLGMFVAVVWRGGEGGWTGIGGADDLFGLCKVAFYSLLTAGTIPGGVGIGEARLGG